jgi:hypothetical protein
MKVEAEKLEHKSHLISAAGANIYALGFSIL